MSSTNFFSSLLSSSFFSLVYNGSNVGASNQKEKIHTSSNISSNIFLTTTISYFCDRNYLIVNKL